METLEFTIGPQTACDELGITIAHILECRSRERPAIVSIAVAKDGRIKVADLALDIHLELATADVDRPGDVICVVFFLVTNIIFMTESFL